MLATNICLYLDKTSERVGIPAEQHRYQDEEEEGPEGLNTCAGSGPRGLFGLTILLIWDWVSPLFDSNQRLICRHVELGFGVAYVRIA